MSYGFTCHNYRRCGNSLDTPYDADNHREAEKFAGEHGWVLGLNEEGAQIACPECACMLFDAFRL